MPDNVSIYSLVKIFEKEQYALDFLRGTLYMNPLSHFREYRDRNGELRGDRFEGIAGIYQPDQIREFRCGDISIPPGSLAGPVRVGYKALEQAKVFCTYSLNDRGIDEDATDIPSELLRLFKLHESCYRLGRFAALILDTTEFINRVCAGARRLEPRTIAHGLVEYFDETTFHGALGDPPGFYKRRAYEEQREHRFLIELGGSNDPLRLDVGDLSDIVVLTSPEEINAGLKVLPSDQSLGES